MIHLIMHVDIYINQTCIYHFKYINRNHNTGLGTGCFLTMSLVELPYGAAKETRHEGYFTVFTVYYIFRPKKSFVV